MNSFRAPDLYGIPHIIFKMRVGYNDDKSHELDPQNSDVGYPADYHKPIRNCFKVYLHHIYIIFIWNQKLL